MSAHAGIKLSRTLRRPTYEDRNGQTIMIENAELIELFLSGDEGAFGQLVRRWQTPVYNFILKHGADHDLAAEVCQKTFVRVFRKCHLLKNKVHFSSWLFRIALNIYRDELKHGKRKRLFSLEEKNGHGGHQVLLGSDSPDHPENAITNQDRKKQISRALQEIPEAQRAVVVLKIFNEMKFREIAKVLGISENTAKARMYYGLEALRQVFAKWNLNRESFEA